MPETPDPTQPRDPIPTARTQRTGDIRVAYPDPLPKEDPLVFVYTNYKGETARRRVLPRGVSYGTTPEHPEPTWLLWCFDPDKQAPRTFDLRKMVPTDLSGPAAPGDLTTPPKDESPSGTASVAVPRTGLPSSLVYREYRGELWVYLPEGKVWICGPHCVTCLPGDRWRAEHADRIYTDFHAALDAETGAVFMRQEAPLREANWKLALALAREEDLRYRIRTFWQILGSLGAVVLLAALLYGMASP